MKDSFVLDQIVQATSEILQEYRLIEIGVGLGDLSERLLKISKLKAYEIDTDLCSFVSHTYKTYLQEDRLILLHCDVLSIQPCDNQKWLEYEDYIVVSNLPYYIATRIIINLLKDSVCKGFVVMTQKEVAIKFCSQTGASDFCALSVLLQSVGEAHIICDVSPDCFEPMPKVTSSVFRFQRVDNTWNPITQDFETLLKVAFSSPRKKLINNLGKHYDKDLLSKVFQRLDIQEQARPHEVCTQKYHQIFTHLKDSK